MEQTNTQQALDTLTTKWLNGGAVSDLELLIILNKSASAAAELAQVTAERGAMREGLAKEIVIGLNIAFQHNLPRSAVSVILTIMDEYAAALAPAQGAEGERCPHGVQLGMHCHFCGDL
jgi:hypothetical protein